MEGIPNRFKLLGQTIEVIFKPERFTEVDGGMGFASYRKNEIHLCPSTDVFPLKPEQIENTFYHELMHFILNHAGAAFHGEHDCMCQDEGFVDLVAGLLQQALNTMEFDKVRGKR